MAKNNWQKITSIFLIGVGVGATVGVLFAPSSGEETRDQISGAVNDGVEEIVSQGNRLGRRAQKTVESAKAHIRDAAEASSRRLAKQRLRILSRFIKHFEDGCSPSRQPSLNE